jgi:hypothetical protein
MNTPHRLLAHDASPKRLLVVLYFLIQGATKKSKLEIFFQADSEGREFENTPDCQYSPINQRIWYT